MTTCELTVAEDHELKTNGNFGGKPTSISGQAKNLAPKFISEADGNDQSFTPIDDSEANDNSDYGNSP